MAEGITGHRPSRASYVSGCRCDGCKSANRSYSEQRRRAAGVQPQRRGCRCEHGSLNRYAHGCRCGPCRQASTDYHLAKRAERSVLAAIKGIPAHVEHGVSAYNNWGCRCRVCVVAMSEKNRLRYRRRAS